METSKTTTQTVNLTKIFSESKRVVGSQRRNFFLLSLLLLLVHLIIDHLFPISQTNNTNNNTNNNNNNNNEATDLSQYSLTKLLPSLCILLLGLTVSLFANALITYTAFHGLNHETTTDLKSAIRSIAAKLFPILATMLLFGAAILAVVLLLALSIGLLLGLLGLFHHITAASPYFVGVFVAVVTGVVYVYLLLNWFLAGVVVVVEPRWGFEALKRSKALMKGNKWIAFYLMLIIQIYYMIFSWNGGLSVTGLVNMVIINRDDGGGESRRWWDSMIVTAVLGLADSCFVTIGQLCFQVTTTVLYVSCKENRRSSGGDEFSEEYSLVGNNEKVASVA